MSYRKGRVTAVHHHSGCCEVVVEGECPGVFAIDNLCMWSIVDAEGADWIDRPIEYEDGFLRFLDHEAETPVPGKDQSCPTSPRPGGFCARRPRLRRNPGGTMVR